MERNFRVGFVVLFVIYLGNFLYLNFKRFSRKVGSVKNVEIYITKEKKDIVDIKELSKQARSMIHEDDKVLFVAPPSLSYMRFNLLSYPIVAKRHRKLSQEDKLEYDYFIFYNYDGPIKYGVVSRDELY